MAAYVRLMRKEDISQVSEIDREAFPTMWPPLNFDHELHNRLAHYLVACNGESIQGHAARNGEKGLMQLASRIRELLYTDSAPDTELAVKEKVDLVQGFAGVWVLGDEAHLMSIAVRENKRRRGIGELLIIATIDMATRLEARLVTLEVRLSNLAAQKLYEKYGFMQVGVRRAYYVDNREDAVIMSTRSIGSAPFKSKVEQLKAEYRQRWGIGSFEIGGF